MKSCTKCGLSKPISEFPKNKGKPNGVSTHCKACARERCAKWYRKNLDKVKAKNTAWRKANPVQFAKLQAEWTKRNGDRNAAKLAWRRAQKLRATPKWNLEWDRFCILEAYALVKLRDTLTGVKWHVDHVVPLKSEIVCGLHTSSNLAVITAFDNRSKGNRYWPDMS